MLNKKLNKKLNNIPFYLTFIKLPRQRSFVCTKGRDHRIQALGITGQGFGITAEGLGGITPKGFQDNCRGFRVSRITGQGFGITAEGLGGN